MFAYLNAQYACLTYESADWAVVMAVSHQFVISFCIMYQAQHTR